MIKSIIEVEPNKKTIDHKEYKELKKLHFGIVKSKIAEATKKSLLDSIKTKEKEYKTNLKTSKIYYRIKYSNKKLGKFEERVDLTGLKGIEKYKKLKEYLTIVKQKVQNKRKELKQEQLINTNITFQGENFPITLFGRTSGVHKEPNTFLKIMEYKWVKKVFDNKNPNSDQNHVGVEIEFYCSSNNKDLANRLYKAGVHEYVNLKTDGSIKPETGMYGHELCIVASELEIEQLVNKVCAVLNEVNSKVNISCGLHVHVDARNRDHEVLFSNLVACQDILYGMNPKWRSDETRENGREAFSRKNKTRKFFEDGNRYQGVNPNSYSKHQTIEIRLHSGTVNARKINNWIKILLIISNRKSECKNYVKSLSEFIKQFKLTDEMLIEYMKERIIKFNGGLLNVEESV